MERRRKKKTQTSRRKKKIFILLSLTASVILLLLQFLYGAPNSADESWALLVAGSWGFVDYRHQADICHAYQLLKSNGFRESNVIVFMAYTIANNGNNPRRGTIINNDKMIDYYSGVPKDYTGENATARNLLAILLGDISKVKGGSGKVLKTGPKDRIFLFYSGHGENENLQMPFPLKQGRIKKKSLGATLKKKHKLQGYKSMAIYINSCLAGNMERFIPRGLNIYILTSGAEGEESSAAYCPSWNSTPTICSRWVYQMHRVTVWQRMDGTQIYTRSRRGRRRVTLQLQYEEIKERVLLSNLTQLGDIELAQERLSLYIGPF